VPLPGAADWERAAGRWLLEACPPDYHAYDVLRRHPVVLARFAAMQVAAAQEATRRGLATARDELRGQVPAEAVEAAVLVLEREGRRLARLGREVELVYAALRGEHYVPRL